MPLLLCSTWESDSPGPALRTDSSLTVVFANETLCFFFLVIKKERQS